MAKGKKSVAIVKQDVYLVNDNNFVSKQEFDTKEEAEAFIKEYNSTHKKPEYATLVY